MTSRFARTSQIGIQSKRNRACLRWMMPAVAAILVTLIYPLSYAFFISLRNWDVFAGTNDFIGLQNYFEVFGDKGFLVPLARTFLYMIIVVGANVVLAMTFALLANTEFPRFRIFIGLMTVPMFLIPAAGATLWRSMWCWTTTLGAQACQGQIVDCLSSALSLHPYARVVAESGGAVVWPDHSNRRSGEVRSAASRSLCRRSISSSRPTTRMPHRACGM